MDNPIELPGADAFGRLSRKAAADALGCSAGTLANWATAGIGPKAYKTPTGGRVFYMATEVRDYALGSMAA